MNHPPQGPSRHPPQRVARTITPAPEPPDADDHRHPPTYTVMTIGGHITWPDTDQLITRINEMADSPPGLPVLVLDVSHVSRPGQAAAHVLAHLMRRQRHSGHGGIILAGLTDPLRRILDRAGLLGYLEQHPTLSQAISAARSIQ
ncbi:sodium-independent anion transporter [Nonomuraea angiospora]|uniref:sodium-independent anion transporter n=1 Tax=Nonomuraea angiospora TaxID=46172 RepID=UPI00378EC18B